MLEQMAGLGINLMAFAAVPTGPDTTQFTLFPEDSLKLQSVAKKSGMTLVGLHAAFLIQGTDELGALVEVHRKLYDADINIFSSYGVADGKCCYGYIIYVRPDKYDEAAAALGV
jgi:hypothetical protein